MCYMYTMLTVKYISILEKITSILGSQGALYFHECVSEATLRRESLGNGQRALSAFYSKKKNLQKRFNTTALSNPEGLFQL